MASVRSWKTGPTLVPVVISAHAALGGGDTLCSDIMIESKSMASNLSKNSESAFYFCNTLLRSDDLPIF